MGNVPEKARVLVNFVIRTIKQAMIACKLGHARS